MGRRYTVFNNFSKRSTSLKFKYHCYHYLQYSHTPWIIRSTGTNVLTSSSTVPSLVLYPLGHSEALVELNHMCEADNTGYKNRWSGWGENHLRKSYTNTGIL